ncbi:MAG: phospholipase D-like domain-containing protein [Candidatus Bathyarchaeota archaeon]|nr:phospholipase D-like domain-containing protein [Candidatus Bathyarchaeota archaeon]
MKESMRVELIENKGPNNMGYELKRSFESASAVDIAVAFITSKGLDLILNDIKKVLDHESSSLRILTRISKDAFNEPSALRSLLDLCKDYEGSAEARITRLSSDFHEKMYLFSSGTSFTIFIGSSNLTEKALIGEGEINAKITTSCTHGLVKQSVENFEEYWNDADELTDYKVDKYTPFYTCVHTRELDKSGKRLWREFSRVMRKRRARKVLMPTKRKIWFHDITGFLKDETERVVKDCTSWDKFQYYSCGPKTYKKLNRNDVLILADYTNKRLTANRIKSKTRTSKTPDGRFFVAFQRIPGSKYKKITRKLVSSMKHNGIIKRASELKPSSAKKLGRDKSKQFSTMLDFKID